MLDYRETTQGSFEAWGTGFRYYYNNNRRTLTVFHHQNERLLSQFDFDDSLSEQPLSYVRLLEKACQINALMVSNNATINLAETMGARHLTHIVHSVGELSRYAFDLLTHDLDRFSKEFQDKFNLSTVRIKFFTPESGCNPFFIARIQTHHGNSISVRACTLAGIMAAMSEKTLRDLMTMEFGHRYEGSAHNLMHASSNLSSLSYILDDNFQPKSRLLASKEYKNTVINNNVSH